jgi:hypothetical protein
MLIHTVVLRILDDDDDDDDDDDAKEPRVPKFDRELIDRYVPLIKPLVRPQGQSSKDWIQNGGDLFMIMSNHDPYRQSFSWNPTRLEAAEGLREVARITTYHGHGYYGLFKPSVAEVISQIPSDILDTVDAFMVLGPDDIDDLRLQWDAIEAGVHRAVTVLFTVPNDRFADATNWLAKRSSTADGREGEHRA